MRERGAALTVGNALLQGINLAVTEHVEVINLNRDLLRSLLRLILGAEKRALALLQVGVLQFKLLLDQSLARNARGQRLRRRGARLEAVLGLRQLRVGSL